MGFAKWIDTLISEKEIDLMDQLPVQKADGSVGHMPVSFIVEHMKIAPASEQAAIKKILVKIDFLNGDICHFIAHCGQALWAEYDQYIAVV